MGDQIFNQFVSKYIRANSDVTIDSIKEQMEKIQKGVQNDALSTNSSVFSFDGEVTKEKLTEFVNSASIVSLDNEVATLFSILDQDGSGNLSNDELSALKRRDGQIDSFSFWANTNVNPGNITRMNGTGNNNADLGNTQNYQDTGVVKPANYSNKTQNLEQKSLSAAELNSLAQKIANGEETLEKYYGSLTLEDYMKLYKASEELKNNAHQTENNNHAGRNSSISIMSRAEAAEKSNNTEEPEKSEEPAKSNKPEKPEKPEEPDKTSYKPSVNVDKYVKDIYEAIDGLGTNEDELTSMIFDEKLSDRDFVEVVKHFELKYGVNKGESAFVQQIADDTSGDLKESLLYKISERLANAANSGNEDAVNLICKQIYASVDGIGTLDEFLEPLFENMEEETIIKVNKNYRQATNGKGENLLDDIKNDYWLPGYGDDIISKINSAIRHNPVN